MNWSQQFEILHKIISQRISESGGKPTMKSAAVYLGIPTHKYQAWKEGQRPVGEDLRMLAQEHEFLPDWLLLVIGEPVKPRLNNPFDPKYVDICDTLSELVKALPDNLPKIAEIGGIHPTDLYNCIHTQAFPPAEAVAKWVIHYRINANYLLAQIGQPFLTRDQYEESGPLDRVRMRRGDIWSFDNIDDETDENGEVKEVSSLIKQLENARKRIDFLTDEIVRLNEERRQLEIQLKKDTSQREILNRAAGQE